MSIIQAPKSIKMKINHEMANDWFSKLPIETKQNIFCIVCELDQAERKHPDWPTDHIHAAAIVGEEAGELLQAALQHKYEKGRYFLIHAEAIQVGAMALRLLNNMPHKKLPGEIKDKTPRFQKTHSGKARAEARALINRLEDNLRSFINPNNP